ncbi:MAG: hypothetical protein OEQ14_09425 [Gammaproteobacteria bacterium]|nr:hypothetical protein [Gammaproteobacteria bacterium]
MDNDQFGTIRSIGSVGLVVVMALSVTSCATIKEMNRTITPNAYSESVGPAQMKADENECWEYGMAERSRLLEELMAGDPEMVASEARESGAENVARSMSKMEGGSTMEGDVAAGVAGFLFSSWDEDTYDESNLAKYLGIEGGLGAGFSAGKRLQYTCLRAKGYKVEDDEEDGSGTAHLVWADPAGITRVILREEDGTERVFYEYITPSKR